MNVGDLKYKIIVQQLQKIKDSYGAEQEVYVNYLELRAGVKYISGTKQVENSALVNVEFVEFTTYYRTIPETCRIVYNNKFYSINSIAEIGFKEGLRINTELIQGIVGDNVQFISGSTLISQSGYEFADVAFSGDYNDLINVPTLLRTEKTLSSNDILNLHTTAVEIIASPGTNKMAIPYTILFEYISGTTHYTNGSTIVPYQSSGGTTALTSALPASGLQSTSVIRYLRVLSSAGISGAELNRGVELRTGTGVAFINGDGTANITLYYYIMEY